MVTSIDTDKEESSPSNKRQRIQEKNRDAPPSLDLFCEGTITVSEGSTFESFCTAIIDNNWNEDFQRNLTTLTISGVEHIEKSRDCDYIDMTQRSQLTGAKSLRLTTSPDYDEGAISFSNFWLLPAMFPNIEEVELCFVTDGDPNIDCGYFAVHCPQLSRFTWNGCTYNNYLIGLDLDGRGFSRIPNLTELHLNDCRFLHHVVSADPNKYMFQYCRKLERLSIKGARFCFSNKYTVPQVFQDMLIEMVRCHPTLRWLRSNLSAENIAMLRQERPDMTFVSD